MMTPAEHTAWLLELQNYITASDVAAVMGLNKNSSRNRVLKDKISPTVNNIEGLPAVMAGKELEAGIFSWFKRHRGVDGKLWDGGLVPHKKVKCLAATPDGIVYANERAGFRNDTLVEVKNVGWEQLEKSWSQRVKRTTPVLCVAHTSRKLDTIGMAAPIHYWVQLQVQLSCMGMNDGVVCANIGGNNRFDFHYNLDKSFESDMLDAVRTFWAEVECGRDFTAA